MKSTEKASAQKLLLVDYENVPKLDLSRLHESYRALVFVGANQNPPRASKHPTTRHRFQRVDFQKIEGTGRNALDFHIAFQLGRIFETAPETECFVLASDKGYDPLLMHLNKNGLRCRRVASMDELVSLDEIAAIEAGAVTCQRCKKASTIEHHGGLWCTNCGCFASPPDPKLLPSNQRGFKESVPEPFDRGIQGTCQWCYQSGDMTGGIFDEGEWMCGGCVANFAT